MFTYEDLHQVTFSVYLERRLIRYLQTFRTALTQLYYNRNSLSRRLRNFGQSIFGFTPAVKQIDRPRPLPVDCVLKGMGLIVAVQERRSSFYIYFLQPQHSHLLRIQHHQNYDSEPADIAIFIRGPQRDYGEVILQHLNPCKSSNYKSLNLSATKSSCNIPINYRLTSRYIRINYMPQNPGTHELAILRRGYHLPGSPFLVTVDMRSQYAIPQTYGFSDDEECSRNKANRRRLKVMFRVVDFVTEKMLLTEDGRLEKLPVLISERILAYRSSQTSSERTCSSPDSVDDSGDQPIQRLKQLKHHEPPNAFKTSPTKKPKLGKDYKRLLRGRWRKVMLLCRFFAKHSSDQRRLQILRAAGHIFDGRPVRLTESTLKLIEEAVSAIPSDKDDLASQIAIDEISDESITLESDVSIETDPPEYETCTTFSSNEIEMSNEPSNLDVSSSDAADNALEVSKTPNSENTTQDQSMEGLRELYKSSSYLGLNLITHLEDEKDKGAITTRRIACSQYRKDATSIVGKMTKTEFEGMNTANTEVPKMNTASDKRVCGSYTTNSQQTNSTDLDKCVNNATEKQRLQYDNDKWNVIPRIPDVTLIANKESREISQALDLKRKRREDSDKDEYLESSKHCAQPENTSRIKEGAGGLIGKCNEYNVYNSTETIHKSKDVKGEIPSLSEDECQILNNINLSQETCKAFSDDVTEPVREESSQCRDCNEVQNMISNIETKENCTALSFGEFTNENLPTMISVTNNETNELVTDQILNTSREKGILQKQSRRNKECPSDAVQAMIRKFENLQKESSIDLIKEKINSQSLSVDNKEMQSILSNEEGTTSGEEDVTIEGNTQPSSDGQDVGRVFERASGHTTPSDAGNSTTKEQANASHFTDPNTIEKEETHLETQTCNIPAQLTTDISSQRPAETRHEVLEESELQNVQHSHCQEKSYQGALVERESAGLLACSPNGYAPGSSNGTTVSEVHADATALPRSVEIPRDNDEKVESHLPVPKVSEDKSALKTLCQSTLYLLAGALEQHGAAETTKNSLIDISKSVSSHESPLPCNDLPKPYALERQLANSEVQSNVTLSPQLSCSTKGFKTINNVTTGSDVAVSEGDLVARYCDTTKEESTERKPICSNNEYFVDLKETNEFHTKVSNNHIQESAVALKETDIPINPTVPSESLEKYPAAFIESNAEASSTTREQVIEPVAVTMKTTKILNESDAETAEKSQETNSTIKKPDTQIVSITETRKTSTQDNKVGPLSTEPIPMSEIPKCVQQRRSGYSTYTHRDQLQENSTVLKGSESPTTTTADLKDDVQTLSEESLTHPISAAFKQLAESKTTTREISHLKNSVPTPISLFTEDQNDLYTESLVFKSNLNAHLDQISPKQPYTEPSFCSDISTAGIGSSALAEPAKEVENSTTELNKNNFESRHIQIAELKLSAQEANKSSEVTSVIQQECGTMQEEREDESVAPLLDLCAANKQSLACVREAHSQWGILTLPSEVTSVNHGEKSPLTNEQTAAVLEDSGSNHHTQILAPVTPWDLKEDDLKTSAYSVTGIVTENNECFSSSPSTSSVLPDNPAEQEVPDITMVPYVRSFEDFLSVQKTSFSSAAGIGNSSIFCNDLVADPKNTANVDSSKESPLILEEAASATAIPTRTDSVGQRSPSVISATDFKASVSLAVSDNKEESNTTMEKEEERMLLNTESSASICSTKALTVENIPPFHKMNAESSLPQIISIQHEKGVEPLIWSSAFTVNEASDIPENVFASVTEESEAVLSVTEVATSTPLQVTLAEQGPLILDANTDISTSTTTINATNNTVLKKENISSANDTSNFKGKEVANKGFKVFEDEAQITSVSVPSDMSEESAMLFKETENKLLIPICLNVRETTISKEERNIDSLGSADPFVVEAGGVYADPFVAMGTDNVEESANNDSLSIYFDAREDILTPSKELGIVIETTETPILYKQEYITSLAGEEPQISPAHMSTWHQPSASNDKAEETGHAIIEKEAAKPLEETSALVQAEDANGKEVFTRQTLLDLPVEQSNLGFYTSMSSVQDEKYSAGLSETEFILATSTAENENKNSTISWRQTNTDSAISEPVSDLNQSVITSTSEDVDLLRLNADEGSVAVRQPHSTRPSTLTDNFQHSEMVLAGIDFESSLLTFQRDIHIVSDLHKSAGAENESVTNEADIEVSTDLLSGYVVHPNVPSEATMSHSSSTMDIHINDSGLHLWDTQIHNTMEISGRVSQTKRSELQDEIYFPPGSDASQHRQRIPKGGEDSHESKNVSNLGQIADILTAELVSDTELEVNYKSISSPQHFGTGSSEKYPVHSGFHVSHEVHKYDLLDDFCFSNDDNLKCPSSSMANEPVTVDSTNSALNFAFSEETNTDEKSPDLLQGANLTTVNSDPHSENTMAAQDITLEPYIRCHQSSEFHQKVIAMDPNMEDPFEKHSPKMANSEDKLAYNPWTTPLICSTAGCSHIPRKQPEVIEERIACNPWSTAVTQKNRVLSFENHINHSVQTLSLNDTRHTSVPTQHKESCGQFLESERFVPDTQACASSKVISEHVYNDSNVHAEDVNIYPSVSSEFKTDISVFLETADQDSNAVDREECQVIPSPTAEIAAGTASKTGKVQCEVQSTAREDCHKVELEASDLMTSSSTAEEFINQEFIRDFNDLRYKQLNNGSALYESNLGKNKSTECKFSTSENKFKAADNVKVDRSGIPFAESAKDEPPKLDLDIFSVEEGKTIREVANNVEVGLPTDTEEQNQGALPKHISSVQEIASGIMNVTQMCYTKEGNLDVASSTNLGEAKNDILAAHRPANITITDAFPDDGEDFLSINNLSLPLSNSNAALNSNNSATGNEEIGKYYSKDKLSPFEDVKIMLIPSSSITDAVSSSTNNLLNSSLIAPSCTSEDSTTPVSKLTLNKSIESNNTEQHSFLIEDQGSKNSKQRNKGDKFSNLSALIALDDEATLESVGSITEINNAHTTSPGNLNGPNSEYFFDNNDDFVLFEQSNEISNLSCSENNDDLDFLSSRTINPASVMYDSAKHTETENTVIIKKAQCDNLQLEICINIGEAQNQSNILNSFYIFEETLQDNNCESQTHHAASCLGTTEIPSTQRRDSASNATIPAIIVADAVLNGTKERNLVSNRIKGNSEEADISPQKEDPTSKTGINKYYPASPETTNTRMETSDTNGLDTPQSNWDEFLNLSQNRRQDVSGQPAEIKIKSINSTARHKETPESTSIKEFTVPFHSAEPLSSRTEDGIYTEALSHPEYSDKEVLCDTRSQQVDTCSVQPEWIDAPYFACRESVSVSDTSKHTNMETHNDQDKAYKTQKWVDTEPKNVGRTTTNTFAEIGETMIVSSRTPEEVRLLEATLLDIEDSAGFCNELCDGFINSTDERENFLKQENQYFELSLDNVQNENGDFKHENLGSNLSVLPQLKLSTLELTNASIFNEGITVVRDDHDTVCNELYPTSLGSCDSSSEEVHAPCFVEGAMACAILDTPPCNSVFASSCPLLTPEDGPVLASSPSQYNVEKRSSFFPDLDDLLSKDFTTYMSSSGDQFHLWPSDVAFGSPSSNLDENIDFDSVLAAPNLEEALRKLEHDIQKRKEEQLSDSTPEEKSEGEAPYDKSLSADAENEDLSSSPSIPWNGDDNNLVEVNMEEEEEENLPDQANGPAEEDNLSYDIGDSDYVSLDDIQSSFKHSPESRDTDDSRNDSSYSAGQREGENEGAASSRNRKLRSFEYSQEEQEFRHMQGGSNAVISGFMGPAEREIWGIMDANGDDKDKPRECAASVDETHCNAVSAEKQVTSEVDDHCDKYDQDSDENEEEESEIDWAAALSNVRCYPRVLSPGSGPTMSAIVEENEDEGSVTRSSSAQLSSKEVRIAKKGSDGDMTNTVSETREELVTQEAKHTEVNTVPELIAQCTEHYDQARPGTSNEESLQHAMIEGTDGVTLMTEDTINENCVTSRNTIESFNSRNTDELNNSICVSLPQHKSEIESESDKSLQNLETTTDISNSGLSNNSELHDDKPFTMTKLVEAASNIESVFQNTDVVDIENANDGELLESGSVNVTKSKVQVLKAMFEKESSSTAEPVKTGINDMNVQNKVSKSESLLSQKMVLYSGKDATKPSKTAVDSEDKSNGQESLHHMKHLISTSNESNDQQIYEQHLETPLISFYTNVKKRSNTPENTSYIAQEICFKNEADSWSVTSVDSVADVIDTDLTDSVQLQPETSSVSALELFDTDGPTLCKAHLEETISGESPQVVKNTSVKTSENNDVAQRACASESSEILSQEDVSTEKFASTVDEIFSEILKLDSLDSTEEPHNILDAESPDLAVGDNSRYANYADHASVDNRQAISGTSRDMNKPVIHKQPIITVTEPTNEDSDDVAQSEGDLSETTGSQLSALGKCIARRRQYWDDILRLAIEQKDIEDKEKLSPQGTQKSPGLTHSEIYRKLCRKNKFAALRSRKPISVRVHGIVNKWRLAFETLKFLEETETQSAKQTEKQPGSNVVEQWKKYWDNLVEEQAQIARYKELSKEEITKQYKVGEKRTLHVSGIVAVGRERFEKISSETVEKKYKDSIRKRRPRRLERNINSASPSPERSSRTNQNINVQPECKPFVVFDSPDSVNTGTKLFHFSQNMTTDVRLSPEQVPSSLEYSDESAKTTMCNNSIGLTFKATVTQFEKEENSELPVVEIEDTSSTTISVNKSSSAIVGELQEHSNGHSSAVTLETKENIITERKSIEKDPETKNRFQKAKQFFQMLEQNNVPPKESNPGPRRRTTGYRKGKTSIPPSNSREVWGSTLSLVEPQTNRHNVEFPDVRPSSVSSAPAYDTWGSIQSLEDKEHTYGKKVCKEALRSSPSSSTESLSRCLPFKKLRSPIGGSERCAKVYEKFHVEDLFKDVVGDCGRNCGSLKGIPHQQAVLASLQSVGDRCLSPYDEVGSAATSDDEQPYERSMATSPLPQGYLPEYPYLSTTPARLYRPRSSLVGSSLITRKDLLSVDKTKF